MSGIKPRAYRLASYAEFVTVADRLRADRKLSHRALGLLVHTGHAHVGRWMRGEVQMFGGAVWALAHALGYDIALIPRRPIVPLTTNDPGGGLSATESAEPPVPGVLGCAGGNLKAPRGSQGYSGGEA